MKNTTAARRYARALFELSTASKSLDDVERGLSNLAHAMKEVPDFRRAMLSPLVTAAEKEAVSKTVTSNKMVLRFVSLLEKRKRLDLIEVIHGAFQELADQAKGVHRVSVKTAMALSGEQKKNVERELAKSLGGQVIGRFDVQQELIGGVWIRLGDKVLDASLRGRFDDLRHALAHSAN